jgi:hypothetical protein
VTTNAEIINNEHNANKKEEEEVKERQNMLWLHLE